MIHKHAFEALDRTLKDVMIVDLGNTSGSLFGGKVVVLGGNFRQILHVVHNGTRNDCVNATISSSYIWSNCKVLKLTKNMRLTVGSQMSNTLEIKQFADWLLDIGQGNLGGPNDGEATITIPEDLLIKDSLDLMSDLIDSVYPSMLARFNDLTYFQEWALLAPLNDVLQEINDRILAYFPGQEVEYLSSDSIDEVESVSEDFDPALYSPDFLNGIKMSGMPNHRLLLKVGVPIMLLRNINQKKGLCNGTRLQVVSLGKRVIEAKVVFGTNIGFRTLLSRISLTPTDKKLPFKLKRRQFPISVCFTMTINKSQGQYLLRVGLYLKDLVFTHGQLYVALSRVKTREGYRNRKQVINDEERELLNVLNEEIFQHEQDLLPFVNVRELFYYPMQNNVVIKYVNGQQKTVNPKSILQSNDIFLLRDLDFLKLSNVFKARAHLDLENEVAEKVKWLLGCQNMNPILMIFKAILVLL
ncbi:uncharacterized protein LOC143591598 [Bidens hawaiensis]|uniref:uncharacterized protein LOC143591598 n=1 Tax=Bidens hawaiensis TaxID=980011 RepID=UPI00404B4803